MSSTTSVVYDREVLPHLELPWRARVHGEDFDLVPAVADFPSGKASARHFARACVGRLGCTQSTPSVS